MTTATKTTPSTRNPDTGILESSLIGAVPPGRPSGSGPFPIHRGEFWTARQRQMHPVHYSISYRASFKPELPDFFMRRYLKKEGGRVLDPFGGRGTTILQANMNGHSGIHNDISPVSVFISSSRRHVPAIEDIARRLQSLDLNRSGRLWNGEERDRFSPFFHERTFRELLGLRQLWMDQPDDAELSYIMLTALSRLHGHSDGFFSAYSFPQISIMPEAQRRNNARRGVEPDYRNVKDRILRKAKRDLGEGLPDHFSAVSRQNGYCKGDARSLKGVVTGEVDLIITSPPFLDKVDYAKDNWMRAWFIGVEEEVAGLPMAVFSDPTEWLDFMAGAIAEMGRVLRPGGRAVIEVGEVVSGGSTMYLEELLAGLFPMPVQGAGMALLTVDELFLHTQEFTKLANCWDVKNNEKGTNTNRCLVLRKEEVPGRPLSLASSLRRDSVGERVAMGECYSMAGPAQREKPYRLQKNRR